MNTRECLECGDQLKGRIDKKFCSDYCRNSYNNKVNKDSKNLIRNMNNRLRKNYKILSDLNWEPSIKLYEGLEKTYSWIYQSIKNPSNTQKFTSSY